MACREVELGKVSAFMVSVATWFMQWLLMPLLLCRGSVSVTGLPRTSRLHLDPSLSKT